MKTTPDKVRDFILQFEDVCEGTTENIKLMDEFEDAFVGLDFREDLPRAVYSSNKIIDILAKEMSHEGR